MHEIINIGTCQIEKDTIITAIYIINIGLKRK